MKILTNEYGYIVSYAIKGDLKDGIEIGHLDNPFEYQYIEGKLIYNPIPEVPKGFIKPIYTGSEFVETATYEEVVVFYNSELVFATKATTEMACKIITEEQYQEVEIYMNSINPYRTKMNLRVVNRPAIFDRYN